MHTITHLLRHLSKVMDKRNGCNSFHGILNLVNIHSTLIKEMMEHIMSLHSFISTLFAAKDKINPFVEMGGDIVTL